MNLFNRMLVMMVCLGLLAMGILMLNRALMLSWADSARAALGSAPLESFTWAAVACIGVALLLLLLELWPQRDRRLLASRMQDGTLTTYQPSALAKSLEKELLTVDGVRKARVGIRGHNHEVDVSQKLLIDGSYNLQEVSARAVACVREKVEKDYGLKLRNSRLTIDQAEPASSSEHSGRPSYRPW